MVSVHHILLMQSSIIRQRTLGLFPPLGYCEQCSYDCGCTYISSRSCCQFFCVKYPEAELWDRNFYILWGTFRPHSIEAALFYILTNKTKHEGSSLLTSSPALAASCFLQQLWALRLFIRSSLWVSGSRVRLWMTAHRDAALSSILSISFGTFSAFTLRGQTYFHPFALCLLYIPWLLSLISCSPVFFCV